MIVQLIINITFQSCIYILISYGFSLSYMSTKFFNLSYAAYITIAGYIVYFLHIQMGLAFILSFLGAIIFTVFLSLFFEIFLFMRLRKTSTNSFILLICSIGIYTILQNIISIIWDDTALSVFSNMSVSNIMLFDGQITNIQLMTIFLTLTTIAISIIFIDKSNVGRKIIAISSNEFLAENFGISSMNVIVWSTIFATSIASITGIFISLDTNITPNFGFNILLYGLIVMIIGGTYSIRGLILAAFLVAISQNLSAYFIGSKWMDTIAYCILILFLLWKPLGFSGKQLKKIEI